MLGFDTQRTRSSGAPCFFNAARRTRTTDAIDRLLIVAVHLRHRGARAPQQILRERFSSSVVVLTVSAIIMAMSLLRREGVAQILDDELRLFVRGIGAHADHRFHGGL